MYQAFGTKAAILARVLDETIAGDDAPVVLLDRDWVQEVRAEADGVRRLAIVVRHAGEIAGNRGLACLRSSRQGCNSPRC